MGSFFSNVSILKRDVDLHQIQKMIIDQMAKQGFTPAEQSTNDTRTIHIRDNPNSQWFTIYEDGSDDALLDGLADSLARKLKTSTLFIQNADSDFMLITHRHQAKRTW